MTNKIAIVTGGSRGLGRNPAVNPARQRGVDTCDFMQESHEYSVIKSVRAPRPLLFAATSPNARKGGYYGPDGWAEAKGSPTAVFEPAVTKNATVGRRLWDESEWVIDMQFVVSAPPIGIHDRHCG